MKKLVMTATLIALPFGLSACDKPADVAKAQGSAGAMGSMAMPAEAKMAKGSGTVTAIETAAGKITLDHGPIKELEWPAMTMSFTAMPELLTTVTVGDKVDFELTVRGNAGEVTAITKR